MLGDGTAAYTPGVAERRNGASKFYHGDYLNSITRETDASQNTTATKQYDAFGMPISSTGSSANPFGYAGCFGYQEDSDSGLKLLGHRYYDPSTGRFLTRDPAKDGRNWYGYCGNNPLAAVDPSGLYSDKVACEAELAAMLEADLAASSGAATGGLASAGAAGASAASGSAAAATATTLTAKEVAAALGWTFAKWFMQMPAPVRALAALAFQLAQNAADEAAQGPGCASVGRVPTVFYPGKLPQNRTGLPVLPKGISGPVTIVTERASESSPGRVYPQGHIFGEDGQILGRIDFDGSRGHHNPNWHPWLGPNDGWGGSGRGFPEGIPFF